MVLSKKNLTIVAKKINHYAFFFVLPASFSMVWHVYNKQRVNIKIRKCVNLFIYLFNKREAEKGRIVKPLLEFLSFACTKMNASFRLKISIHPRLLSFHEFRDPSISKVSVKRHSPTTEAVVTVGTFSLRLGRNVKRLTSLRICTYAFFLSRFYFRAHNWQ